MKLVISYNNEIKKVMIKVGEEKEKEMNFEELLLITNEVIDNNVNYEVEIFGFDDNPDVGENYKKIIGDILNLKNDPEIIDLKSKTEQEVENEQEADNKIDIKFDDSEYSFSDF